MEVIVLAQEMARTISHWGINREGLAVLQLPVEADISGRSASSAGYLAI